MRQLYREHIAAHLKKGDLPWLARRAARYLGVQLSYRLARPLAGPILGTIVTNYSCNLRCRMCDLPLRVADYGKDGLTHLDTDEMLAVIDGFAALGTLGIGFTGGEPMLRKDLFELLERSRQHRMITHLNTNGTFLDDGAADRIIELGIDSVNLSLDGPDARTHDAIRGKDGNFREVLDAAGRILERRSQTERPRVKFVAVLGPDNIDSAEQLVELAATVGVDSVDFIPLHDFDRPGSSRERPRPGSGIGDNGEPSIGRRLQKLAAGGKLDNSSAHLELFDRALSGAPSPLRCFAGYNSLVVDGYGRIFPCVPWSNQDRSVGNVRTTPIEAFWKSAAYDEGRAAVRECKACYLNCQTELNLMFQRAPRSSV